MTLTRIGASSRASDRARVSAAALVMATPRVPTAILAAATPEKMTNEPPVFIRGARCLASMSGPITLVSKDSRIACRSRSGTRPRARAEPGDGRLVGQVDGLGADARLVGVGGAQCVRVAAGRDNLRAGVLGGQGDRAGEPAAAADDEHGLVFQWSGHGSVLSRKGRILSATASRWLS